MSNAVVGRSGLAPRLSVRNLHVVYRIRGADNTAINNVSIDIPGSGVLAIVGESGSGKSTLAHTMVGLLPSNGRVTGGAIDLQGVDLLRCGDKALRSIRGKRIGFVPQDPMMSLNPTQKVGTQVAEAIKLHERLSGTDLAHRIRQLLAEAGLPDPARTAACYPHELSGGMRQRVLIAIAFASSPEMIIADEPTSALDATVSMKILEHLMTLVEARGTTLVIITHDLALAARHATEIAVMSQGRVVEQGTAAAILSSPRDAYTRRLLESSLQLADHRNAQGSMTRRSSDCTLAEMRPGVAIKAENLHKRYGASGTGFHAVRGVSFTLSAGRTLALVGESGSGKSTTARMILGLEEITEGEAEVLGQDVRSSSESGLRRLRERIQLVYQSPFASLDPRFTVAKIIDEPLRSFRRGTSTERRTRVMNLLDRVGLPSAFAERMPRELSGGQRQRVAIARALALSPEVVVLDEPVSALDASVQAQILDLLLAIQADTGVSYLFISHDLSVVYDVAHEVAVMKDGLIVEKGATDSIFRSPEDPYTALLLEAAFRGTPGTVASTTH